MAEPRGGRGERGEGLERPLSFDSADPHGAQLEKGEIDFERKILSGLGWFAASLVAVLVKRFWAQPRCEPPRAHAPGPRPPGPLRRLPPPSVVVVVVVNAAAAAYAAYAGSTV